MNRIVAALLLLIAAAPQYAAAIGFTSCQYRPTDMKNVDGGTYDLGVFHCQTDEDLFFKSTIDPSVVVPSTATLSEVQAAIDASAQASSFPAFANFASVINMHGTMNPPAIVFSGGGNYKLKCADITSGQNEWIGLPNFAPPTTFLFALPPVKNSINELWQAFGASKFPEPKLARTVSFAIMHGVAPASGGMQNGSLTRQQALDCIASGALEVIVDNGNDAAVQSACAADPNANDKDQQRGCSFCGSDPSKCVLWKLVDSAGNLMTDAAKTAVTRKQLTCDPAAFETFTADRMPKLTSLLDAANSRATSEGALMTYSSIVNNEIYVACKEVLDSLYTTTSRPVTLKGVRVCDSAGSVQHPNGDPQDPCCNESLRWSDCCLASDRTVTISGLYDQANVSAISTECGANNLSNVKAWLDSDFSPTLIAAQHPELGCEAKASLGPGEEAFDTLVKPVKDPCADQVLHGKSKLGKQNCASDDECWSGSCLDNGHSKECARSFGEAAAEPMLKCTLATLTDDKLWTFLAKNIGVDPSVVNKDSSTHAGAAWDAAVAKFRTAVGSPSCGGDTARNGWCTVVVDKATCQSMNGQYVRHDRMFTWITDTNAPSHGGYCKKNENYVDVDTGNGQTTHYSAWAHDDQAEQKCQAMIATMGGVCKPASWDNTKQKATTQSACESGSSNDTWVSLSGVSTSFFRLARSQRWVFNPETVHHERVVSAGNQALCELEKSCNWDPDNSRTQGDESACLDPSQLTSAYLSTAALQATDGTKMTCLECWGSRCQEFHRSSAAICVAAPHFPQSECTAQTGLTPKSGIIGGEQHWKCREDNLKTQAQCLDQAICPAPQRYQDQDSEDTWIWNCAESMCIDTDAVQSDCTYDSSHNDDGHRSWRPEWAGGSGLCKVDSIEDSTGTTELKDKTLCEAEGFTWFPGRAYRPEQYADAQTCTDYPQGHQCTESCAQCLTHEARYKGGACVLAASVTNTECDQLDGYSWEWNSSACSKKDFSGDAAACTALNNATLTVTRCTNGGDSGSQTACEGTNGNPTGNTFVSTNPLQAHEYYTCTDHAQPTCGAYCHATGATSKSECDGLGFDWEWDGHTETSICKVPPHRANAATSPSCASYTANIDANSSHDDRRNAQEACGRANCQYNYGNNNGAQDTCTGTPRGCDQQTGSTFVWVGSTSSARADKMRAGLLRCRWEQWAPCSTQQTCEASGECNDWQMSGGACLVPFENDRGHRKGCNEMKNPNDQQSYAWAEKLGCIAMKAGSSAGTSVRVPEAECSALGGTWETRAKTQQECEGTGKVCTSSYSEWDIFGGIQTQQKCEQCGHTFRDKGSWRGGVWRSTAPRKALHWRARQYSSVNSWANESFDEEKYQELLENAVGSLKADFNKSLVQCKLGPYSKWIPLIARTCTHSSSGSGSSVSNSAPQQGSTPTTLEYEVSEKTVPCGAIQSQAPDKTAVGSIDFTNAVCAPTCTNSSGADAPAGWTDRATCESNSGFTFTQVPKFDAIKIQQVTVLSGGTTATNGNGGRRLGGRRLTDVCAAHRVVTNSAGASVGQKLGSGLQMTGANNVTMCLPATVPPAQQCASEFTVKDIVQVTNGNYGQPLGKTVTMNAQGEHCFDGANSGIAYVPVLVASNWQNIQPPAVNCAGTWSTCNSSCSKTFSVTTPQSGSGTACPNSPATCSAGEGACPAASTPVPPTATNTCMGTSTIGGLSFSSLTTAMETQLCAAVAASLPQTGLAPGSTFDASASNGSSGVNVVCTFSAATSRARRLAVGDIVITYTAQYTSDTAAAAAVQTLSTFSGEAAFNTSVSTRLTSNSNSAISNVTVTSNVPQVGAAQCINTSSTAPNTVPCQCGAEVCSGQNTACTVGQGCGIGHFHGIADSAVAVGPTLLLLPLVALAVVGGAIMPQQH